MKRMMKKAGMMIFVLLFAAGVLSVPEEGKAAEKGMSLNGSKLTMVVGQSKSMSLLKADGSEYTMRLSSYKSSNKKVADVSDGYACIVVTAKKPGTATITVEYNNKKYSCRITVIKKFALANTKGKNAADVAALKKIVKKHYKEGVSVDLNDKTAYSWNKKGRLTNIDWMELRMTGSISLNGLTELEYVNCSSNQLTGLDASRCNKLKFLSCGYNDLSSLKVGNCKSIYCAENSLSSLDLSSCTDLNDIYCYGNQLSSLDLSSCTKLVDLRCQRNQLTSLNVNGCGKLQSIDCSSNQLSSLDLSSCTKLETLHCYINEFSSLDLSSCVELADLNCHDNKLTSIDLSSCTKITDETVLCDEHVKVKYAA